MSFYEVITLHLTSSHQNKMLTTIDCSYFWGNCITEPILNDVNLAECFKLVPWEPQLRKDSIKIFVLQRYKTTDTKHKSRSALTKWTNIFETSGMIKDWPTNVASNIRRNTVDLSILRDAKAKKKKHDDACEHQLLLAVAGRHRDTVVIYSKQSQGVNFNNLKIYKKS